MMIDDSCSDSASLSSQASATAAGRVFICCYPPLVQDCKNRDYVYFISRLAAKPSCRSFNVYLCVTVSFSLLVHVGICVCCVIFNFNIKLSDWLGRASLQWQFFVSV